MKILITGFTGFVAQHFLTYLNEVEKGAEVLGIDKTVPEYDFAIYTNLTIRFQETDLLNRLDTSELLKTFQPEYILHLASVSSVAQSWQTPVDSFVNNTNIFLNLVDQIRLLGIKCRTLSIGSSEEFGDVAESELPLTESHVLNPISPYAVARVAQEMLSKIYSDGYNLDIIMTRSFNHIGPGQKSIFVISSFAKQLVTLSRTAAPIKVIKTGNLEIIRDFVDVRDVVKAYYLLLKKGRRGEVYNICSGKGVHLGEILDKMSRLLQIKLEATTDPSLIRPNENRAIVGSYSKINSELNWEPTIPLDKSLEDIVAYWESRV